MLIHWRRANLRGTLFSELPDGRLIKPVGHAYDVGGPLSGVKATNGAVVDSTTIVVYFSQCVSFSGPLFTGIEYSIDGGSWTTVTGENKISDTQWEFTTGTIPINAEVRWRYVEDSGTLVDCVDIEDIGEQGPLNLSVGLLGYYFGANFDGPNQKLTAGQLLSASDGVQVGILRARNSDNPSGVQNEILNKKQLQGVNLGTDQASRSGNTNDPVSRKLGVCYLARAKTLTQAGLDMVSIFIALSNSSGSEAAGYPSLYWQNGELRSRNAEVAGGGYSAVGLETVPLDDQAQFDLAIVCGGFNAAGKPYVAGDNMDDFTWGASMFCKRDSDYWKLVYASEKSNDPLIYFGNGGIYQSNDYSEISSLRIPQVNFSSLLAPTAYFDAPSSGTAFAHKADTHVDFKLSSLPTAGTIEIRFRVDWAVTINTAGDVTLIEDIDGAATSRGSALAAAVATSRIVVKTYGVRVRVHIDTAGAVFEYDAATRNLFGTAGAVASLGTGGALQYLRCNPWGSEKEYALLDSYPGIPKYGVSDAAEVVLSRMNSPTPTEVSAIADFVDGCVADGNWEKLDEFFCFPLNAADWLTGFKQRTCTIVGSVVNTTRGAQVTTTNSHLDTHINPGQLPQYKLGDGEAGIMLYSTPGWGAGSFDLFGVNTALANLRFRHRGNDTQDISTSINNNLSFINAVSVPELERRVYSLRDDGNAQIALQDGAILPVQGAVADAVPNDNVWIFRSNASGSGEVNSRSSVISAFYIGRALDTAKLVGRIQTLMEDIMPPIPPLGPENPELQSAVVDTAGTTLTLTFDKDITGNTGFTLTAAGNSVALSLPVNSMNTITFTCEQVFQGEDCLLSYSDGDVINARGEPLENFTDTVVDNNSTAIPGSGFMLIETGVRDIFLLEDDTDNTNGILLEDAPP